MNAYNDVRLNIQGFFAIVGILYINIVIIWYFDKIKVAYDFRRKNEIAEAKLEVQKQYNKQIENSHRETIALWHDITKHVNSVKALVINGLTNDANMYFAALEDQIDKIPNIIMTSDPVVSALLTEELSKCKKAGVDFRVDINIENETKITPIDLCVMLGNAIENAINACNDIEDSHVRFIDIKILQKGNIVLIDISNTYSPTATKVKVSGHSGYGLSNIQKVVDKYSGHLEINRSNRIFHLSIIIP